MEDDDIIENEVIEEKEEIIVEEVKENECIDHEGQDGQFASFTTTLKENPLCSTSKKHPKFCALDCRPGYTKSSQHVVPESFAPSSRHRIQDIHNACDPVIHERYSIQRRKNAPRSSSYIYSLKRNLMVCTFCQRRFKPSHRKVFPPICKACGTR